jgi:hypothetical protein
MEKILIRNTAVGFTNFRNHCTLVRPKKNGGDIHLDIEEDRGLGDEGGLLGLLLRVGLQPLSPAHADSSF